VTLWEAIAVFVAGIGAGTINAVVGSGTLITFPTLLWIGYDPVTANVSNCVGLVPGSVAGSIGYRRELAGQRGRVLRLGAVALVGGTVGAIALLVLPESAFEAIVPVMIAIALVLVVFQPRLSRWLGAHRAAHGHREGPVTHAAVLATGIYGGYFGAAQGILLLAGLGLTLPDDIQRINALKNVLAALVNGVAGVVFVAVADIAWGAVAVIAVGSVIGGTLGARYGRRLSPGVLRGLIVVIGVLAIARVLSS
jgi:uncharacterized membrane protein YfcA